MCLPPIPIRRSKKKHVSRPRPLPFLRPPGFIFNFLFTKKEGKKIKFTKNLPEK